MPTNLYLLGIPWKLTRFAAPEGDEPARCLGEVLPTKKHIRIMDSSPQGMTHILIHELAHCAAEDLNIRVSESSVRRIAQYLAAVLLDNNLLHESLATRGFWEVLEEE